MKQLVSCKCPDGKELSVETDDGRLRLVERARREEREADVVEIEPQIDAQPLPIV